MAVAAQKLPPSETGVPALEARGIVREYGRVTAVAGINVSLEPGDFLTVFGPNGAGKSSLLGLLAGALRPTRGDVFLNGIRLDFGAVDWRRKIGVLSHKGFLYAQLTVEENLQFYGRLHGLKDLDERIPERLDYVRLVDRSQSLVGQLSHGMRQRLALARALLHDPDIVLLDEPYTGLDPSAASVLRGVLTELKDGRRTVVMVTHNLGEGLALANRVAIQVRGKFAWQGNPDQVDVSEFDRLYHRVVEGRA